MSKQRFPLMLVIVLLAIVSLACGGTISTANIRSAKLTTEADGSLETTVFNQDDLTVYCIVELANAPSDTVVRAVWIAADVESVDPNTVIDETSLTSGDATLTFDLTNSQLWPLGDYKVELYINDKLDRTLEYQVR